MRENDRKLLFEEAGIITMRPSDVPTYVEAGAADIGITGKDVLMEQPERERPRARGPRLRALRDGGGVRGRRGSGCERAAASRGRAGRDQVPAHRDEHFLATGRQAEIVEVKGSVELAPLTGLVDAIVDLTATGTTLRENNLVIREEIAVCTARLIANPVADKLKADAIDALVSRIVA